MCLNTSNMAVCPVAGSEAGRVAVDAVVTWPGAEGTAEFEARDIAIGNPVS